MIQRLEERDTFLNKYIDADCKNDQVFIFIFFFIKSLMKNSNNITNIYK